MNKNKEYCAPLKSVSKEEYTEMFPDLRDTEKLMDEALVETEDRMTYLPKECSDAYDNS